VLHLGAVPQVPGNGPAHVFFLQPKVSPEPQSHVWTRSDIPLLYTRISAIVERAKEARRRKDFEGGEPHYPELLVLQAAGTCPAVTKHILQVGRKFSPVQVPENITPSLVLDGPDVSVGLQLAGLVKAWAESYRSAVTNRVIRGEADCPPGQKLVSTQRRVIADVDKFKAVALNHLSEQEYLATFTPEFGPIEKLISTKAPRGQKTAAVEAFGEELFTAGAVKKGEPVVFLRAVATDGAK
jgi:hypothetical protein